MTADAGDGSQRPDWMSLAVMLARNAPGLGDPFRMPIDLFVDACHAVCDMLNQENGDTGRNAVDREMRRLLG